MRRKVSSHLAHLGVPIAWRGNCHCGKWLVVLRSFSRDRPLTCGCGVKWFIAEDEAVSMFATGEWNAT